MVLFSPYFLVENHLEKTEAPYCILHLLHHFSTRAVNQADRCSHNGSRPTHGRRRRRWSFVSTNTHIQSDSLWRTTHIQSDSLWRTTHIQSDSLSRTTHIQSDSLWRATHMQSNSLWRATHIQSDSLWRATHIQSDSTCIWEASMCSLTHCYSWTLCDKWMDTWGVNSQRLTYYNIKFWFSIH